MPTIAHGTSPGTKKPPLVRGIGSALLVAVLVATALIAMVTPSQAAPARAEGAGSALNTHSSLGGRGGRI
jgi:hypothetical protein